MKWLATASFLFLFLVAPAEAQSPQKQGSSPGLSISAGELKATPEMWFYEQSLRQYNDPKWVIRQKAEYRTAERLRRMAALKWYGFSNGRPTAGVDPIHGDYGPHWTSGNVCEPFRWSAGGAPTIVVISANRTTRR